MPTTRHHKHHQSRSGVSTILRIRRLALETSWLGDGAQDFYGTAWEWGPDDSELFFELARRSKLLMTIDATVICCGYDEDVEEARECIAQELVVANSAQELKRLLIGAEETR
ncbi:hypothetical protein QP925_10150 [Corynebacterium accolens]|nr:hypothetical protein [Corynebacterium accolens]MDK8680204.1 hypothetical protein [Corynebacterium accolens]